MTTVLVVDDEPRISGLVRDYLDQAGFRVVEAADGPGAIEAFDRHRPDLIILDLGLPGVDGLDVIRRIRTSSDVPIVILSARTDDGKLPEYIIKIREGNDEHVEYFIDDQVLNFRNLIDKQLTYENGDLLLPTEAGLGFGFDAAAVDKWSLDGWS